MISRRQLLLLSAGGAVLATRNSLAAPDTTRVKKRVVRATIPYDDPEAGEKIRQSWARMFAAHGFIDGEIEIEVVMSREIPVAPKPEYDEIVRRVLESRPDVILVHGSWLAHFARHTREVPIVFSGMIDPEEQSFIDTARRPGGNITGSLYPMWELQAKRIALAKEMMPRARRVAVVTTRVPFIGRVEQKIKETAAALGMEGVMIAMSGLGEKDRVTKALREARADIADITAPVHRDTGGDMLKMGIAGTTAGMEDGGIEGILVSYDAVGLEQVAAELAGRILRGEKASTLPAQGPQTFEMTINLRTARALGITVPSSVLLRATQVFE